MPESSAELTERLDINVLFNRYLIDMKYALQKSDLDDGIFVGDDHHLESGSNKECHSERILLQVEQQRLIKQQKQQQAEHNTINAMAKSLRPHILKAVEHKLTDHEHIISNVLKLPSHFTDLVDLLYSPSCTYSRVAALIKQNQTHERNLLYMVNRRDFQKQTGREMSQRIRDPQVAVSMFGLTGAKALLPVMITKQSIKLRHDDFPLLGYKLWKMVLSQGLTCHYLLSQQQHPDPAQGLLAAMIANLGKISIYHQFAASSDEIKYKYLVKFRKESKKLHHDYLLKVQPDGKLLYKLMQAFSEKYSLKLIEHLQLNKRRPKGLVASIEQALTNEDISKCDPVATALRQASCFSRAQQLIAAKLLSEADAIESLAKLGLSQQQVTTMLQLNLSKLELRKFIE